MRTDDLLVVAGEASGDRAAAGVLRALGRGGFGLGGPALASAGLDLVGDIRQTTALGVTPVVRRTFSIAHAYATVMRGALARKPKVALLVNFTEFNARLARTLHAKGLRVLWYVAPQVWAWRKSRAHSIRRVVDRMAVVLPFEEALWRELGVDAHYVGHPVLESERLPRNEARRRLELTPFASAVAILPGSRREEVERLLPPMLQAFERVRYERASIDARVLLAASLDEATRSFAKTLAKLAQVEAVDVPATTGVAPLLPAFEASLCASGTVSLEAALARAIPVVAYRVDRLTEIVARRLVTIPHVALPNILLRRRAFPELIQDQATSDGLAIALERVLNERAEHTAACTELELVFGDQKRPSATVARQLEPWLR